MEPIMEALKTLQVPLEHGYEERTEEEEARYRAELDNRTPGDLGDGVDCPKCLNRGFITEVRHNEQFSRWYTVAVPCTCQKKRAAVRRLRRSGLSEVIGKYTFDAYETPDKRREAVKSAAVRYAQEHGNSWFFMGGQSGAGKSHLCTAICGALLDQGKELRYMLWRDEMNRIKQVANEYEPFEELMNGLKRAEVLYIDDLFKKGKGELPTVADIDHTFEILNYRYNNPGLLTIISSERTLPELNEIDEATAGRIAEMSKAGGFCLNLKKDSDWNWRMRGLGEI